jgi:hypothetical protein
MTDDEIERLLGQLRQIARLALVATAGAGSGARRARSLGGGDAE